MRTGTWSTFRTHEKRFPKCAYRGNPGACRDRPAVTRKKEAVSGNCSEKDDKRFRIHLVRPRAEAHSWGRGARILTEINRLPQPLPLAPGKNSCQFYACRPLCHRAGRSFHLSAPAPFRLDAPWHRFDARDTADRVRTGCQEIYRPGTGFERPIKWIRS